MWVHIVLARFDDGDDEVEAKVRLFEEAEVASGFEAEELRGIEGSKWCGGSREFRGRERGCGGGS